MKLTLACITGNASKYIDRFLDSFQPHVDEIIMVRAIGNQEPDDTLDIAKKRGCVTGEYKNKQDWPHIDDFAAARNVAFDMATGDWVMWADLDDVLDRGEKIKADLEAMPEECVALGVPYDIRDDQLRIMRERIIRRGTARWVNPVHEQLDFGGKVNVAETNLWQIIHQPLGKRTANDERNTRILESIDKPNGGQRFHLVQSLRALGRDEDAVREGSQLLMERPDDIGQPELYEVAFTLAQIVPDPEMRAKLMFQALMIDPTRREAYGDLCTTFLATGQVENAQAMVNAMKGLEMPDPAPWNIRRKFYGYAEPLIEGMVLRRQGRIQEANTLETNHVLRHGAKISLCHATRGRPEMAAKCRRDWMERAADPDSIEHIFSFDLDDDSAGLLTLHRHTWSNGCGGPVEAWNRAASEAVGQVIIQLSDDWNPPLHWDKMILDAMGDLSAPKVLAVSDGHREDQLLCMAILTQSRLKQQGGHMFHPEFFSMYSDNWFSKRAWEDGVVIDARDSITFEHLHPAFGKGEMDETYARSNAKPNYAFGQGTYNRLDKGIATGQDVPGWCDYRDLYAHFAQALPDGGRFVEIGCWKGQSIITLCQKLQDLGKTAKVFVVDTFKGEQNQPAHLAEVARCGGSIRAEFETNIEKAGVADMITVIEGDSAESASHFEDGELDGVFIDAAHDYDSVVADVAAWFPKVKPEGIFAGHDFPDKEVKQAIAEHSKANDWQPAAFRRCWLRMPKQNEEGAQP